MVCKFQKESRRTFGPLGQIEPVVFVCIEILKDLTDQLLEDVLLGRERVNDAHYHFFFMRVSILTLSGVADQTHMISYMWTNEPRGTIICFPIIVNISLRADL